MASHVNECEKEFIWTPFYDECKAENIEFDKLSDDTKAICFAVVCSASYIAKMVASAHHDSHKTTPYQSNE